MAGVKPNSEVPNKLRLVDFATQWRVLLRHTWLAFWLALRFFSCKNLLTLRSPCEVSPFNIVIHIADFPGQRKLDF